MPAVVVGTPFRKGEVVSVMDTSLLRAISALCIASVLVTSGCHASEQPGVDAPLTVVLVQTARGSELVSVDLARMQVARRMKLRSLCLSIATPVGSRTVVTAQCGGPDRSADTAAGFYQPDSGAIDYVDLGVQNPLDVCAAAEQAMFVHGLEQRGGLVTSRMNLTEGRRAKTVVAAGDRVRRGSIGARALKPEVVGSQTIVPELDVDEDGVARLVALPNLTGTARIVATLTADWCGVVSGVRSRPGPIWAITRTDDQATDDKGAAASGRSSRWALVTIAPGSAASAIATIALPPLEHGCADSCIWNGRLAIADASGVDMANPGDSVRVFDPRTGEEFRRLRIAGGMPAALATWDDRLLVVDGISGDLFVFNDEGRLMKRIRIGGVPIGSADQVVIP